MMRTGMLLSLALVVTFGCTQPSNVDKPCCKTATQLSATVDQGKPAQPGEPVFLAAAPDKEDKEAKAEGKEGTEEGVRIKIGDAPPALVPAPAPGAPRTLVRAPAADGPAENEGWAGLMLGPVPPALAEQLDLMPSLMVENVVKDSPADKAGIRRFDVIISIGKKPAARVEDFVQAVRQQKPGSELQLVTIQKAKERKVTLTLGKFPGRDKIAFKYEQPEPRMMGGTMQNMPEEVRKALEAVLQKEGREDADDDDDDDAAEKTEHHGKAPEPGAQGFKFALNAEAMKNAQTCVFVTDGQSIQVSKDPAGKFTVTRTSEGGKKVDTKTYENLEAFKKADPKAAEIFIQSTDPKAAPGGVRIPLNVNPQKGQPEREGLLRESEANIARIKAMITAEEAKEAGERSGLHRPRHEGGPGGQFQLQVQDGKAGETPVIRIVEGGKTFVLSLKEEGKGEGGRPGQPRWETARPEGMRPGMPMPGARPEGRREGGDRMMVRPGQPGMPMPGTPMPGGRPGAPMPGMPMGPGGFGPGMPMNPWMIQTAPTTMPFSPWTMPGMTTDRNQFKVAADGSIEVHATRGNDELTIKFTSEEDMKKRAPRLSEIYGKFLGAK